MSAPASPTRRRSPAIARFMVGYFRRYLRRHLNALRIARWSAPLPTADQGPLVLYLNHPAWWDAALIVVLADRLLPGRESYAPIEARMLERYGIFGRIGAFGIEPEGRRGGEAFLKAAADILSRRDRALWVTAQGRFADVRTRPLALRPGIAHCADLAPGAVFVPVALEYAFWEERGAEAFCALGPAITAESLRALPRRERLPALEAALTATLDRLSADVMAREADRFDVLDRGRAGVGGIYDAWRRLAALATGRSFDASHGGATAGPPR